MKLHLETRELLADSYASMHNGRRMLSHAVMVSESGQVRRVVCERVKLDSIAGRDPAVESIEPTCQKCRKGTRGMKFGKVARDE